MNERKRKGIKKKKKMSCQVSKRHEKVVVSTCRYELELRRTRSENRKRDS
jgi:hypothetical protein